MHRFYFKIFAFVQRIFKNVNPAAQGRLKVIGGVLTQHHEAGHFPAAPALPVVYSPGNSSPPGCAAPSCGGCAGWASGLTAQIAAGS